MRSCRTLLKTHSPLSPHPTPATALRIKVKPLPSLGLQVLSDLASADPPSPSQPHLPPSPRSLSCQQACQLSNVPEEGLGASYWMEHVQVELPTEYKPLRDRQTCIGVAGRDALKEDSGSAQV